MSLNFVEQYFNRKRPRYERGSISNYGLLQDCTLEQQRLGRRTKGRRRTRRNKPHAKQIQSEKRLIEDQKRLEMVLGPADAQEDGPRVSDLSAERLSIGRACVYTRFGRFPPPRGARSREALNRIRHEAEIMFVDRAHATQPRPGWGVEREGRTRQPPGFRQLYGPRSLLHMAQRNTVAKEDDPAGSEHKPPLWRRRNFTSVVRVPKNRFGRPGKPSIWTTLSDDNHHGSSPSLTSRQLRSSPPPGIFPFLSLPRELREMIYDYFRVSNLFDHEIIDVRYNGYALYDFKASPDNDFVPLNLPTSSGFLAYHGIEPPLNLSLACKQLHRELWDHMFEVGPLTPHADEWRFDPTYQKLAKSKRLPVVQRILVRIELVDMKMETRHFGIHYCPLELEECVLKVQALAEMLVRVLRRRGKDLVLVMIDWKDDFADEKASWDLKASVLLPFGTLEKVQIRLNKLIVAESQRRKTEKMLVDTLEGLSAMA